MHKEAQQAAGGPTSLKATSKEGAHPQLSSGFHILTKGLKTAHTTLVANEESRADDISQKVKLEDLSNILKDTRSAFFTPDSLTDVPIIISDESEEEENAKKDKDTEDTLVPPPPSPKSAQIQKLMGQPSYPDINQLTELLVTSLKPKLSKLLASHNFASCLPTEMKELPSNITGLSGEIKELKWHIKDMEIELSGDLIEIPTKLDSFTSTISSLSSQVAELKNIQWKSPTEFLHLPSQVSLVQEKLKTLDSLLNATKHAVPSAAKQLLYLRGGEEHKEAVYKPENELIDLLGKYINKFEGDNTPIVIQPPCYSASKEKTFDVVAFVRRAAPLQMVFDMRRTRRQVLYAGKSGDARYPSQRHPFSKSTTSEWPLASDWSPNNMEEAGLSINGSLCLEVDFENDDDDMMIDAPSVRDLHQLAEAGPSLTEKPTNGSLRVKLVLENSDHDTMIAAPSVRDLDQLAEVSRMRQV
ncbi:hypothetical protein Tco_0921560 [Tanacetum coccineum]